ncbi:hypothetical protein GIB67_010065, partial [Kingdonia uniflora]
MLINLEVVGDIHFYLDNNGPALPLSQTNQSQEYPEVITLDIDEGPALPTQPEVASPIFYVDPHVPNVDNVKKSTNIPTVEPKRDIDKCDEELRNFAEETENIFGVEENTTVVKDPFQKVCDLVPEIEWPTVHVTRAYIRRWSIVNKVFYHQINNESYRIILECSLREEGCKWLFYARIKPDGHTFKLKKSIMLIHTCIGKSKSKNKLAHAEWVANEAENTMRTIRSTKPCDVIELIKVNYGIDISYYTAWNAWTICMERIVGSYDEGYVLQPELCRQILSFNPGSIVRTSKDININQWTGTCIDYKASLDGFVDGCRPILGLDGCFLKGKYGLVPRAVKHIAKMETFYGDYHPEGVVDGYFVVIVVNGQRWRVNTEKHECDCNEWQLNGLSCVYAVSMLLPFRESWV